ncbi:MAG: hypothetical protein QNJ91_12695 [Gammaproteobacteria bacterium]|nr:hypothetical protein [Gammaproteobacteria bacterium]
MTTPTFFRPAEVARERTTLPAQLYNGCRLALARCEYGHVFIPLREMEVIAVIDETEVIFVDKHAYTVRDGSGGRLIVLAWQFAAGTRRDDVSRPAPIDVVHYDDRGSERHMRLVGELSAALQRMAKRTGPRGCQPRAKTVIPFRRG